MLSSTSQQALFSAIRSTGRRHLVTLAAATSQSLQQQWSAGSFCNNNNTQREQRHQMSTAIWSRSASTRDGPTLAAPSSTQTWSHTLSFATPESDFVASGLSATREAEAPQFVGQPLYSESLSFASPESDFVSSGLSTTAHAVEVADQPFFSETLSFASPESDFTGMGYDRREHQRLPFTLAEALMESHRALVVTTAAAPHRIVHVNHAWEDLCCLKREEVLHKTLRMIQGPESNPRMVLSAVDKVLHDQQHHDEDVYVVNYKGNGEKFINHLSIGRLFLDKDSAQNQDEPEFLVGILEEVEEGQVPLRLSTAM